MNCTKNNFAYPNHCQCDACKNTGVSASDSNDGLCAFAEQLEEAAQLIADWGSYASPYFQEKHGLQDDIDKFNNLAALARKAAST